MAEGFVLDIKNLAGVISRLEGIEYNLKKEVDDELTASAQTVARNAKINLRNNGSFDEGSLANRINVDASQYHFKTVGANVFYAPYIEFGTRGKASIPIGLESYAAQFKGKSGHGGGFYEFALAILGWIKRKGIKTGTYSVATRKRLGSKKQKFDEDVRLAEAIAFTILKKGIKPRPFLFPALQSERVQLITRITNMILKK